MDLTHIMEALQQNDSLFVEQILRREASGEKSFNLKDMTQEDIHALRSVLLKQLSLQREDLAKIIYDTLLALAEVSPLNEEDPLTLEAIAPEWRVRVSMGYQFDIQSLIAYHVNRDYRGSALHETDTSKYLLNPLINLPFSLLDVRHIKAVAEEKGVTIEHLKIESWNASSEEAGHMITTAVNTLEEVPPSLRLSVAELLRTYYSDDRRRSLLGISGSVGSPQEEEELTRHYGHGFIRIPPRRDLSAPDTEPSGKDRHKPK